MTQAVNEWHLNFRAMFSLKLQLPQTMAATLHIEFPNKPSLYSINEICSSTSRVSSFLRRENASSLITYPNILFAGHDANKWKVMSLTAIPIVYYEWNIFCKTIGNFFRRLEPTGLYISFKCLHKLSHASFALS